MTMVSSRSMFILHNDALGQQHLPGRCGSNGTAGAYKAGRASMDHAARQAAGPSWSVQHQASSRCRCNHRCAAVTTVTRGVQHLPAPGQDPAELEGSTKWAAGRRVPAGGGPPPTSSSNSRCTPRPPASPERRCYQRRAARSLQGPGSRVKDCSTTCKVSSLPEASRLAQAHVTLPHCPSLVFGLRRQQPRLGEWLAGPTSCRLQPPALPNTRTHKGSVNWRWNRLCRMV